MLLKELHSGFLKDLRLQYDEHEASVITSMVFETIAGVDKATVITEPLRNVEKGITEKLGAALEQLQQHVPVQYVLGHAWFYHLNFKVSPAVLVPRPETEELVQEAINFIKEQDKQNILDIGTGSGCIPISIKKNIPGCNVSALDISEDALMIARENASKHLTEIKWLRLDFLDKTCWNGLPVYDVILSNPPYIPENEKEKLDKNVTDHEPLLALFVPDNRPLVFYEKIAEFGKKHLARQGMIFVETHEDHAQDVADHFLKEGYQAIVKKDFYEKERMVLATHSL